MADKMLRVAVRGSDGLAKPLAADIHGNIGARIAEVSSIREFRNLDFSGKPQGNSPHVAKRAGSLMGTGNHLPPVDSTSWAEFSQNAYTQVEKLDELEVFNQSGNGYGAFLLEFDLLTHLRYNGFGVDFNAFELKKSVKSLIVDIHARARIYDGTTYYPDLAGVNLYAWNFSTSEFIEIGTNTVLNEIINYNFLSIENYIGDNGKLILAVRSKNPSTSVATGQSLLYLNYAKVDLKLIQFVPFGEIMAASSSSSSLEVIDVDTDEKVELSAVTDNNGKSVLRVVDAAPHAFDELNDKFKVIDERNELWLKELHQEQLRTATFLEKLVGANAIYDEQGERVKLIEGNGTINATATKEEGYLHFTANNPDGPAYRALETDNLIDLTYVRYLVVDWENVGQDSSLNQSRLQVSLQKNAAEYNWEKQLLLTNNFARQESKLDVSDLKGKFFINVFCRDGLSGGAINSELKVYSIRKEV